MSNFRVVTPTIQLVKLIFPPLRALQCSAPPPLVHAPSVAAVAQAGKGCPIMPARRHHLPLCSHCLWLPSRHGVKPLRHYPPRHRLLNDPASEHRHSPRRRLFVDPASEQRKHQCPSRPRLVVAPVSDAQHCRQPRRRLAVTPVSEHRREPQRQVKVTPAGEHCHPSRRRLFVKPAIKESKQSKRRVSNAVHAAPTCCRASDQRVSTLVSSVADLTSCQ